MVFGGGAFGRWLGHEDRAFTNGIKTFVQEAFEKSLPTCTGRSQENNGRRPSMNKKAEPLSDTESMGTLILDFSGFRTSFSKKKMRNKMTVAYKPPSTWYFFHSNPERLKQGCSLEKHLIKKKKEKHFIESV